MVAAHLVRGRGYRPRSFRTSKRETTSFLYDGWAWTCSWSTRTWAPKAEYYFANGQVLGRKMFGVKGTILPEREPGLANGGTYYYLTDALGSVTDLVDHNGQVAKQYRYDAFGGLFTGTVGLYNTIGLTGKNYDSRAGLMDYGARWYDPQVGRFTQVDPFPGFLDWPLSQHGYSYVENDPVNRTDPTGMLSCGHPNDECTGYELLPGPSYRVPVITRIEPDIDGYWEYGYWQLIETILLVTYWRDGSSQTEIIQFPSYDGPYENFVPTTGGGGEGPPPPPPPPSNDEIRDESNRQMRESGGEAPVTKVYAPGVWEELQKGLQTNWEGYTLGHSGALNVTYTGGTDYPTHPLVTKAKEMLRDLSGFPHVIDNEYGPLTSGYIEQFQRQSGLLDVPGIKAGVLDEATYDALKRVHQAHLASRVQAGTNGATGTCDGNGNCLSVGEDTGDGYLTQDTSSATGPKGHGLDLTGSGADVQECAPGLGWICELGERIVQAYSSYTEANWQDTIGHCEFPENGTVPICRSIKGRLEPAELAPMLAIDSAPIVAGVVGGANEIADMAAQKALNNRAMSRGSGNENATASQTASGSTSGTAAPNQRAPSVVKHPEVKAPNPVKPGNAISEWDNYLGPGPHSNVNPYTKNDEPDRLWSSDGTRSIRYGNHEMGGNPTKHHYHQERWILDSVNNELHYHNTLVRVPLK